jgi:hypothetical protein
VEVASIEVFSESDAVSGGFLIKVERGIIKDYLGRSIRAKDR